MRYQAIFYRLIIPVERLTLLRIRIERRFKCKVWVTKAGQVIPTIFMNDDHLRNSWNMVYRNAVQANSNRADVTFDHRYTWACILKWELDRRGATYHKDDFDHLESIFMAFDGRDFSDHDHIWRDTFNEMMFVLGKD